LLFKPFLKKVLASDFGSKCHSGRFKIFERGSSHQKMGEAVGRDFALAKSVPISIGLVIKLLN